MDSVSVDPVAEAEVYRAVTLFSPACHRVRWGFREAVEQRDLQEPSMQVLVHFLISSSRSVLFFCPSEACWNDRWVESKFDNRNDISQARQIRCSCSATTMGGSFSKKPKAPPKPVVTSVDRAVLDLKNARDRLQRYRQKLEEDDSRLLQQARKARDEGKKERALGLMRLRKYKQTQTANCEEQLLNVYKMVETIDSKQNEAQLLQALRTGKDQLKKMHEETSLDDILNLMDDIREENEKEQEITDILSDVPTLSISDEEAAEAELAALVADMNGATKIDLPVAPSGEILPVAPSGKLPEVVKPAAQEQRVAVPG